MQEPYGEGLASHPDPESCVVSRTGLQVVLGSTVGVIKASISLTATRDSRREFGRHPSTCETTGWPLQRIDGNTLTPSPMFPPARGGGLEATSGLPSNSRQNFRVQSGTG
jgi:hypothetical protein